MRERILSTADRLFYSQGIRAIGVDTVAAEAGISKRTLYNHFSSKEELVTEYLRRRLPAESQPIDTPPEDQILGLFDAMEYVFAQTGYRGCPFVNAVTELGDPDQEVRKLAVAFKEQRRDWFRRLLDTAGVADADSLSFQLLILLDGAIAATLVRQDPTVARHARAAAAVLLASAGLQTASHREAY
ncbi:TetR/AcrR family transcriptional regulator [Nocardia sp. NPDC047648]|uniref:TetR/AcrR family transcriptional regulator n=1 Tax=Nocardia sp. NPDC047648 TaxID=3155625 RepID=UPI0033EC6892